MRYLRKPWNAGTFDASYTSHFGYLRLHPTSNPAIQLLGSKCAQLNLGLRTVPIVARLFGLNDRHRDFASDIDGVVMKGGGPPLPPPPQKARRVVQDG
jgi:hypothetical protein